MASEILKTIASDIKDIDGIIEEAEELISAMKEAGEETHDQVASLQLLKVRKAKWQRMLQARGL